VAIAMASQLSVAKTQENFVSVFGNLSYREENKAAIVGEGSSYSCSLASSQIRL
jgi:hypothetical protein